MAFRFKRGDPINRAISDLDQQIATVQRQMREVTNDPAAAANPGASPRSTVNTFTRVVKEMLTVPQGTVGPSSAQARRDLFDVEAEPLKELEAEPIAFAQKPEPDLFEQAQSTAQTLYTGTGALETAQVVPTRDKLAHYLGAGSIKSYKPLKRVRRQTRNRFFMWMGLSCLALWLIWFVIR
jgi:hypothetical protein